MAAKKESEVKVEEKAIEAKETEKATAKKKDDEKVTIMVPYVEGEDPEVTVIINGVYTRFRKGETVQVSRAVASVLKNSNKQMMAALKNQKKFEKQVTDL